MSLRQVNPMRVAAFLYIGFHLYTAAAGPWPNMMQRSVHVMGGLALLLWFEAQSQKTRPAPWRRAITVVLALVGLASAAYIALSYDRLVDDPAARGTPVDIAFGVVTVLLVLYGAQRVLGWVVVALVASSIVYALAGSFIFGPWAVPSFSLQAVTTRLYLTPDGIWGIVTGVSSREIAGFIIFGSVLMVTGGARMFMDFARWIAGRRTGGGAQVTTVASLIFGMVNGSAAANASSIGAITIPMMKKLGYSKEFAAGAEAVASTGGQLSPPVMGAAAFIMSELTGVPYAVIALAAIVPTAAYYLCDFFGIYFYAKRVGLRPMQAHDIPPVRSFVTWRGVTALFGPVLALIYFLFVQGMSPVTSALLSTVLAMVLYLVAGSDERESPAGRFGALLGGLADAGLTVGRIAVIIGSTMMLVSMLSFTGLAIVISQMILQVGKEALFPSLVLGALVVTLLGMAMPSAPAFMTGAAVVAPALMQLGLGTMPAYMFVFYYAILAAITPPICDTLYVASGIAGANAMKAAGHAVRLAAAAWVVPIAFVYHPELLYNPATGLSMGFFVNLATLMAGAVFLSAGLQGFLLRRTHSIDVGLLVLGGLLLIWPDTGVSVVGLVLTCAILLRQWIVNRRAPLEVRPSEQT